MSIRDRLSGALVRGLIRLQGPPIRKFRLTADSIQPANVRPPVAGRLLDWMTTTPQYPPSRFRTFVTFGYRRNTVFRTCVDLLANSCGQADLQVVERRTRMPVPDFPALQALRYPAPRVTERELWKRFVIDFFTMGNALWEKVRDISTGEVVELWRLDPGRVAIEPDPMRVIKRYLYNVAGQWYPIAPEDVLHWKAPDPLQPYFGIPPIYSAFRDLAVDNEITDHFKVTLQNLAIPAVVLEHPEAVTEPEADEAKRMWMRNYGAENLGKPAVIGGGTKVTVIGMDMQKLAVGDLIGTSESRIAMAHRVPIILLGRSGTLADPTRSNYAEAKEHFWFDTIVPLLSEMADQVTRFIIAEFDPTGGYEATFDTSEVPVLQEARLRRGEKAASLFTAGLVSRHQSQRLAGVAVHGPDVFYRSANVGGVIPADATTEVIETQVM